MRRPGRTRISQQVKANLEKAGKDKDLAARAAKDIEFVQFQ